MSDIVMHHDVTKEHCTESTHENQYSMPQKLLDQKCVFLFFKLILMILNCKSLFIQYSSVALLPKLASEVSCRFLGLGSFPAKSEVHFIFCLSLEVTQMTWPTNICSGGCKTKHFSFGILLIYLSLAYFNSEYIF